MICSFTQTYSSDRRELFDYHDKDAVDIRFRNKLDGNYYAFHNSQEKYKTQICNRPYFHSIERMTILTYNDVTYPHSLLQTLMRCRKDGAKYLFFLQDDVFSLADDKVMDELLHFVRTHEFDMLNIDVNDVNTDAPVIYSAKNLKIYNTSSIDFMNKKMWPFDDGPYVANVDFLIRVLYDSTYFSMPDIWSAEVYLCRKIRDRPIQRLSTNINIFRRFNIVGRNLDREFNLNWLNRIFV